MISITYFFLKKINKEGQAVTYYTKMLKPNWLDSVLDSYLKVLQVQGFRPCQVPHTFKMSDDYHYQQQYFEKAAEQ